MALNKPIIVIKPGRSRGRGQGGGFAHRLADRVSDEVLEAAFRRSGVLRVNNIADLFYMAEVLSKQPSPQGAAPDHRHQRGRSRRAGHRRADHGRRRTGRAHRRRPWKPTTPFCRPPGATTTPSISSATPRPERYAKALEIAAKDPNSDGMLVILTPQAMTDPTQIAEQLKPLAKQEGKPVLASWMGGVDVAAGEEILNRANIPTFPYPDTAARAFNYMWQYSYNLKGLYETPSLPEDSADWTPDRDAGGRDHRRARAAKGAPSSPSSNPSRCWPPTAFPRPQTIIATDAAAAVKAADEIGYPVVLKLYSETITHKTDVGGVQLNLGDAEAVRARLRRHPDLGHREGRRAAFPGRHRAAHDQAQGRLRADHRIQPRPAVRAGAAVRHRRATGGSLQGPRAGAAAAEHHAGAPHDGADQDLQGAQGRARPQAGGPGGARSC